VHGTLQIEVNSERCISSVQELNKDSIKFSLSTWTRSVIKLSQAKSLQSICFRTYIFSGIK